MSKEQTAASEAVALEDAYLTNRDKLLTFIARRGALDPEDILNDLWLRLPRESGKAGQIQSATAYLYRMANSLIIDRHRQRQQASRRDMLWTDAVQPSHWQDAGQPGSDRELEARQTLERVVSLLVAEGPRVSLVFRRHRIDGLSQREVAAEVGIGLTTVENDLRRAYRALARFQAIEDEA